MITAKLSYSVMPSPVGDLLLTMSGGELTGLYMTPHPVEPEREGYERDDDALAEVRRQLEEYWRGERQEFDVPLAPRGTAFQTDVWEALLAIPYGKTASYSEIAARVGHPKACRAVGLANGRNPISIIVPCHRVIGANGSLTGYGGGLDRKIILLDLERQALVRT